MGRGLGLGTQNLGSVSIEMSPEVEAIGKKKKNKREYGEDEGK